MKSFEKTANTESHFKKLIKKVEKTFLHEPMFSVYVRRQLSVQIEEKGEMLHVVHLHHTSWDVQVSLVAHPQLAVVAHSPGI